MIRILENPENIGKNRNKFGSDFKFFIWISDSIRKFSEKSAFEFSKFGIEKFVPNLEIFGSESADNLFIFLIYKVMICGSRVDSVLLYFVSN